MGDVTGDLPTELTGESIVGLMGEAAGDMIGELADSVPGTLTGEATGIGEGTDERHSGLLATGEGVVRSGFFSSGMNGSGKKRVSGDFTRGICKGKKDGKDFINIFSIRYCRKGFLT